MIPLNMILFTEKIFSEYKDSLLDILNNNYVDSISHKWLLEMKPKRMIYTVMYGDLFGKKPPQKILDVGGGYNGLTKILVEKNEYHLLDIDDTIKGDFHIQRDWHDFKPDKYDLIIANDLFPNVDQRLELFIKKFIPQCKEMRLSLTYHNQPYFYKVKRTDVDATLFMLAYEGLQVESILDNYADRIAGYNPDLLLTSPESLFANGRLVAYVSIKGDL